MPGSLPVPLVAFHRRANQDSAGNWAQFAGHRERVTELAARAPGGRLCVLAAGNCNDLDLTTLAAGFDEIHLVDVDRSALARAFARHGAEVQRRLVLHAPVDLTGALGRLPGWKTRPPTGAQLERLPDLGARHLQGALPGPFDVVVSACFVSQLMRTCYVALGNSADMTQVAAALAIGHVRALQALIRPAGRGILVTDVISSETYPLDELFPVRGGDAILEEVVARDMVYAATSPLTLGGILDAEHREGSIQAPVREPAWLWTFSPERSYLVYALTFVKCAGGSEAKLIRRSPDQGA